MPMKVVLEDAAPSVPYQLAQFHDSDTVSYYCYCRNPNPSSPTRSTALPAISGISNAADGVVTFASAHQLHTPSNPRIELSGLTLGWAGVNGSRVVTVNGANTVVLTGVDTSLLGAVSGAPVAITLAPKLSDPVWAIKKEVRDVNGRTIFTGWAEGTTAHKFAPASRGTYAYY